MWKAWMLNLHFVAGSGLFKFFSPVYGNALSHHIWFVIEHLTFQRRWAPLCDFNKEYDKKKQYIEWLDVYLCCAVL